MDYLEKLNYYKEMKGYGKKPRNVKNIDSIINDLQSKIDSLLNKVDSDSFISYYSSHSRQDTMVEFKLNQSDFKFLIHYYNYKKPQSSIKALTKQTNLVKYGCSNPMQNDAVKKKAASTNVSRYGADVVFKSDSIKSKIAKTNLTKYGCKNVFSNSAVKEKIKQSNLNKYGVDCFFKSEIFKESSKKTKFNRYGDENYNNRQLATTTCLKRYGVAHPASSTIIHEKMKRTMMRFWGVENPAQSREIAQKMSFSRKNIIASDGTSLDSNWEKLVYEFCIRNGIPIERNIPFEFEFNDEKHYTMIDFKIDGVLVEVKNKGLLLGCFDHKLKVPISRKLDLYRERGVVLITDFQEMFDSNSKHFVSGLKGVSIDLFNDPKFPLPADKPLCFYKVSVNGKKCSYDAFNDEHIRWRMIKNRLKYSDKFIDSHQILNALNITKTCKQPSWFSKKFAVDLLKKYATTDFIVDPFAGWGTRHDASVELNKSYYGGDLNSELVSWHQFLGRNIVLCDASDFKFDAECSVLTCPPYGDTEIYFNDQNTTIGECGWLSIIMKNIPNAKEYIMVCKHVDDTFKKYIVDKKVNKSHFGENYEYILVVPNHK